MIKVIGPRGDRQTDESGAVSRAWNHQSVRANGVQLHFVREGNGEPLIFLHGWPGFWYDWSENLPVLGEHFDCIAPDMRGFGYSEKPSLPPEVGYNDGSMAADILEFLNELGLARASLVAHDFGALWAQRFARSHAERVARLVLFNPPYLGIGQRWREPQHGPHFWHQYFHALDWTHKLIEAGRENVELYVSYFLNAWCHPSFKFRPEVLAEYIEACSQPGAIQHGFDVFRAAFRGGNQIVLPEEKIIALPTLILWGEDDPCVPIRWADRLGEFFANYSFLKIPRCGHYPMREKPELVHDHILRFFKKKPAPEAEVDAPVADPQN